MTEEEKIQHALRLLAVQQEDIEYSLVYEDELLRDEAEADQLAVYALMNRAQVFATWPEAAVDYQIAGPPDEED